LAFFLCIGLAASLFPLCAHTFTSLEEREICSMQNAGLNKILSN
jgi:hypothetical protein